MSDVGITALPDVGQAADATAMLSFLAAARTQPGLRIAEAEMRSAPRRTRPWTTTT